jgi:orotate phosphoribosyltransferase
MSERRYMETQNKVVAILKKVNAIMTDSHFVLTSGKHSSVFIRKDRLYPFTSLTSKVCRMMATNVSKLPIDIVVGPSLCGIVLSQWVASHLSKMKKKEVLSVFTEKPADDKQMFDRPQVFKRGYDVLVKGKNVLVVEDLTTTGGSVKKVVDQVQIAGGRVVCVYVLANRNPKEVNDAMMGVPFKALAVIPVEAYDESDCPLCKKGIPINTEVGHGKEYLAKRKIGV